MIRTAGRAVLGRLRAYPSIFLVIRRVVTLPQHVYQHLYFYGKFSIEPNGGRPFRMIHHGHQLENSLFWAGYSRSIEGGSLQIWAKLSRMATTILDVGSNTGVYALAAASVNSRARVIALEPVSRIFRKLKANICENAFDIEGLEVAASDLDGEITMYDTTDDFLYSASLQSDMLSGVPKSNIVQTTVACCKLDTLKTSLNLGKIDLIKIDVELHEPQVLIGMKNILSQDMPTIIIEVLDEARAEQVFDLTSDYDYTYYFIDESGCCTKVVRPEQQYGNYLLCPPGVIEAIS